MKRWTDAKVAAQKPGAKRKQLSLGRGLYFIVEPWGAKYWRYRYKIDGAETRMKLGDYPAMGLAKAEEARNARAVETKAAREGHGPAPAAKAKVERAERLAVPTVADLSEEWLQRKGDASKTKAERRRTLRADVLPKIGAVRVGHIKRLHCKAVIDQIMNRDAPAQAAYAHKVMRAMFRYAVGQGYVEASPMESMPSPAPYKPKDRALSEGEVRAMFAALEESDISISARLCLEWQLVTAARPTEARTAGWREIDLSDPKQPTWTIPAARSKNRKPHIVYLSPAAAAILNEARLLKQGKNAPLFPGRNAGESLSFLAVTRAVKRLHGAIEAKLRDIAGKEDAELAPFTPHDLRRTAATLVTSLGFSRFIAGLLLNHTEASVTAIYDRNTYDEDKRLAWRALGERVAALKAAQPAKI